MNGPNVYLDISLNPMNDTKRISLFALGLVWLLAFLSACEKTSEEELLSALSPTCDSLNVSYAVHIQPLVAQNCAYAGCHSYPGPSAGLALEDYASMRDATENGSVLSRIQRSASQSGVMPKTGPMDACSIRQIVRWAQDGYQP